MRKFATALIITLLAMMAVVPVASASGKPYVHCSGGGGPGKIVITLIQDGHGLVQPTVSLNAAERICDNW